MLIAALGFLTLGLGACGFTPLYGAPGVGPKLASIEVVRPDGRTGYLMGQYLDDDFAKDRAAAPAYRLTLKTRETRIPRGIRVNNVASRYELQLTANYLLTDAHTRAQVTSGLVQVTVTYDSADQPYAAIAAQTDGQQRAAEQAAQRIRLELANFFANPTPAKTDAVSGPAAETAPGAYSERLQPATILSPRERALGQLPSQSNTASSLFGQPLQSVAPNDPQPPQTDSGDVPPAPGAR